MTAVAAQVFPSARARLPDPAGRRDAAMRLYRERRDRDATFGRLATLFRDPAWDVALHLFVAAGEGRTVYATGAAFASRTPMTTGLRCIDAMVAAGMVRRRVDPEDARRSVVTLTHEACEAMGAYIDGVVMGGGGSPRSHDELRGVD